MGHAMFNKFSSFRSLFSSRRSQGEKNIHETNQKGQDNYDDDDLRQLGHEKVQKAGTPDSFTLQDFVEQLDMISRLGSISKLAKYIPGVKTQKITDEQMLKAENEMKRFKIIINSMTPQERLNHKIIDGTSKIRIAQQSGVPISEINTLIQRFEEMQQYVKLFKK